VAAEVGGATGTVAGCAGTAEGVAVAGAGVAADGASVANAAATAEVGEVVDDVLLGELMATPTMSPASTMVENTAPIPSRRVGNGVRAGSPLTSARKRSTQRLVLRMPRWTSASTGQATTLSRTTQTTAANAAAMNNAASM